VQPLQAEANDIATVTRGTFLKTLRLDGLVEAVEFVPVQAPQLVGAGGRPIVITYLAPNGTSVLRGDLVVEFDRQQELRTARDRRAEWLDLDAQVQKRRAELAAQDARNDTTLEQANTAVSLAQLDMLKNDMLPRIEAEKHMIALDTAEATLTPLRQALMLKHAASDAEIRILETRRDRLAVVTRQAERNAERMAVRSSIAGLVVYRSIWRRGQFGDPREGLEVWPGTAVLDVVNANTMRVRARVNQADIGALRIGLSATVRLDAVPARRIVRASRSSRASPSRAASPTGYGRSRPSSSLRGAIRHRRICPPRSMSNWSGRTRRHRVRPTVSDSARSQIPKVRSRPRTKVPVSALLDRRW
jgi:HlyD family secretion protein